MRVVEHFQAWGHPNITANNRTTFEFTKDRYLTPKGDCIIAVGAGKGAADLDNAFKELARNSKATIIAKIAVNSMEEIVIGRGSPRLPFTHSTDLVGRKRDFMCERTPMIKADRAANDFPREMIQVLRSPLQLTEVILTVEI